MLFRRFAAALVAPALAIGAVFAAGAAHAGTTALTDEKIANPNGENAIPLGHGRMAEQGALSFVLYTTEYTAKPFVYVRDTSSTAVTHVALPEGSTPGYWGDASYAVTSGGDLWVLSGGGPVYVRRYHLSGSPLPTTATLVSTTVFGDTDSRAGALTVLASGAVVGVWHQQGYSGPSGLGVAYWSGSAWSTQTLAFMPTKASNQALVQHPGDNSVWLLNDPDGWHAVGAAHFTETTSGLRVDWTDATYIDVAKYGNFGPDAEKPDVEAAADPSTGTIVVAYQGNVRTTFSNGVTGSYPVIARLGVSGAPTFASLPIWAERISSLGVIARPGEVWLAYRPVDTATLTFSNVAVSRFATSTAAWDAPITLGSAYEAYGRIGFGLTRIEFTNRMADDVLHRYSTQPVPGSTTTTTSSSTTSTTTSSTSSSSPTKGGGKKK